MSEEYENLKPFFVHEALLRRWFDLLCISCPQINLNIRPRLSNQSLSMQFTALGLIKEIRRNGLGANVLIEEAKARSKGILNRRTYTLPTRLVYRAPYCQIILYAPHTTRHGRTLAGRITVEIYGGKLPHEKAAGLQLTQTFEALNPVGFKRDRPKLSVTNTIDALETKDLPKLLKLQPLVEAIAQKEGLRLLTKHMFEVARNGYAKNDQWSADLQRLAILANETVPENNK